jgi:hypothetical protein
MQGEPEIKSFEPLIIPHGQKAKLKSMAATLWSASEDLSCYFDKEVVQAKFVSSKQLLCLSPALKKGEISNSN